MKNKIFYALFIFFYAFDLIAKSNPKKEESFVDPIESIYYFLIIVSLIAIIGALLYFIFIKSKNKSSNEYTQENDNIRYKETQPRPHDDSDTSNNPIKTESPTMISPNTVNIQKESEPNISSPNEETKSEDDIRESGQNVETPIVKEQYTVEYIEDGFIHNDSLKLGVKPKGYFLLEYKEGDDQAHFTSIDSDFTRGMIVFYWTSKFLPYFEEIENKPDKCNKIINVNPAIFKKTEGGWKLYKKGILKLS